MHAFAEDQYEKYCLKKFVSKEYYLSVFVYWHNQVMEKTSVTKAIIKQCQIAPWYYNDLLEDLNNRLPLFSMGYAYLHEMLRECKTLKCRLGIVTNGRDFYQKHKIEALGIKEFFDIIVTSGALQIKKPNPYIFQYTLDQLNAKAGESVFIGDNLEADIIPAQRMGFYTIHKSTEVILTADKTVNDLSEMPIIIRDLNGS